MFGRCRTQQHNTLSVVWVQFFTELVLRVHALVRFLVLIKKDGAPHTVHVLCPAVDEGTCMTPHSPSTIRAFYAEEGDQTAEAENTVAAAAAAAVDAAAAAGVAAERGSNGGRVSAASSSAYEVMEFKPAQPEPQVRAANVFMQTWLPPGTNLVYHRLLPAPLTANGRGLLGCIP